MTTTVIRTALHDNLSALKQASEVLASIAVEDYRRRSPACFNSTVGGHLRHVIEHYFSVLGGLESTEVDYAARPRDAQIETDPAYAAAAIKTIATRLQEWVEHPSLDRALRVRVEAGAVASAETETEGWATSSLLRELDFLLSHTIHHYALIGVIYGLAGAALPVDFGVAPSTLRYRNAEAKPQDAA
jgi:DinB superfamily